MKSILLSAMLMLGLTSIAQTETNSINDKYILKIAPTVKFSWATSAKAKRNNNYPSYLISGIDVNFLLLHKKNNYHDFGLITGFFPNTNSRNTRIKSFSGFQLGLEYSYRISYTLKKSPNIGFFTSFGTQTIFSKTNGITVDYFAYKSTTRMIQQNLVFTPGIQYSKNKFYFDFSVPTSLGYEFLKSNSTTNSIPEPNNNFEQKYHLFNWNIGFKASVGVKF